MGNRNIDGATVQLALELRGGGDTSIFSHQDSLQFDDIVSAEALFAAWAKFRRGKRTRPDVMAYERHLEWNIFGLHEQLASGQYRHGGYQPFTIHDPKQRQIHKATVQDRLVHQALVSAIEPLFEPQFIYDSYSCRKGKGTHAAVARLRSFLNQASCSDTRTVYALKCDIKQFFASVDHQTLMGLLKRRISNKQTLDLLQEIIDSLYGEKGQGMPLGNLTSQLFANVYLNELDWHVKQRLCRRHYLRYCDDFIILGTSPYELGQLVGPLTQFLHNRLGLTLHPNKITIRSWGQGVDFLGHVVKPDCTILRTKTKQRMLNRVNEDNISSYLGLCSHVNGHELEQVLITVQGESD